MRSQIQIQHKIAQSIERRDVLRPQLQQLRGQAKTATNLVDRVKLNHQYFGLAVRMTFTCGLLSGLYHALGYSNQEIRNLLEDPDFSGLIPEQINSMSHAHKQSF